MSERKACDGCGERPSKGDPWRARRRECDGKGYCPECRLLHPATKPEHRCAGCGLVKPISEFYTKHGRPNGACKACILDRHRIEKYGVTPEMLAEMLAEQDGLCAICLGEMPVPYVDHCHSSGSVRGALCRDCNTGLGMFRDNVTALARAIDYLSGAPRG